MEGLVVADLTFILGLAAYVMPPIKEHERLFLRTKLVFVDKAEVYKDLEEGYSTIDVISEEWQKGQRR